MCTGVSDAGRRFGQPVLGLSVAGPIRCGKDVWNRLRDLRERNHIIKIEPFDKELTRFEWNERVAH